MKRFIKEDDRISYIPKESLPDDLLALDKTRRQAIRKVTKHRDCGDQYLGNIRTQFVTHPKGQQITNWFIKNEWREIGRDSDHIHDDLSILTFEKDGYKALIFSFDEISFFNATYSFKDFVSEFKKCMITEDEYLEEIERKLNKQLEQEKLRNIPAKPILFFYSWILNILQYQHITRRNFFCGTTPPVL